ncbi:MAG: DUF455 family protein [Candidatus Saccharimonas sp.]|nr:DUF455 family protein [Planctomycetaceae bacterium]
MELRSFAERVLLCESLDAKLERVRDDFTDEQPGAALRVVEPARSADLKFAPRRAAPAMPHPGTFVDPAKRAIAHHIMANHELQALEVMAWVLLAFPEAPREFRLGLAKIMEDEQRHTRMHIERAAALGLRFGDLPVNGYIWKKSQEFQSVLDYLAGMPLTFEGRNLDHTLEFDGYFTTVNDPKSAAMMQAIHRDEIQHVAFGLEWLRKLKPAELSDWDAYVQHLHFPLRPDKSVGDIFHAGPRLAAGMSAEFVERLRGGNASPDE